MNILSLGINDITNPVESISEYFHNFARYFEKNNTISFINILTEPAKESIIKNQLSESVTQTLVSVPEFFYPLDTDIWKYTQLIRAVNEAQNNKIDVILMHDYFFAPVLDALPIDSPVVYMLHNYATMLNQVLMSQSVLAEMSEEIAMKELAHTIITPTQYTADDIIKSKPELKEKIMPMNCGLGVDKKVYYPNANLTGKTILFMGKLDEQNGILQFLDNIARNKKWLDDKGLKVTVAGRGQFVEPVLQAQSDGLVEFYYLASGYEKHSMIGNAKYMVFPSRYDPWGLTLNEGLASGKLCIANDSAGGHRAQIQHGHNGWLTDEQGLIETIKEIEDNAALQTKVSETAHQQAASIDIHMDQLHKLLHALF